MRRHLLRFTFAALLICGAAIAFARSTGAPRARTGAPAIGAIPAEATCNNVCHSTNPLNDPSGAIEILDLPAQFEPDTDYPVRIRVSHNWDPLPETPLAWGFEVTAVRSDSGTGYGTFTPGPDTKFATGTSGDPSRAYVTHDEGVDGGGIKLGEPGPVEWTLTWRSPSYEAPMVYFFAAGNSANGDGSTFDDWIFTTSDSMSFQNVDVPMVAHGGTALARPYPNPARGRTELRYTLAHEGAVELSIFDLSGRRVRTLMKGPRSAGPGSVTWDGRDASGRSATNGLYFARLTTPGTRARVQKITLSR